MFRPAFGVCIRCVLFRPAFVCAWRGVPGLWVCSGRLARVLNVAPSWLFVVSPGSVPAGSVVCSVRRQVVGSVPVGDVVGTVPVGSVNGIVGGDVCRSAVGSAVCHSAV
jgi:hypothetical protein